MASALPKSGMHLDGCTQQSDTDMDSHCCRERSSEQASSYFLLVLYSLSSLIFSTSSSFALSILFPPPRTIFSPPPPLHPSPLTSSLSLFSSSYVLSCPLFLPLPLSFNAAPALYMLYVHVHMSFCASLSMQWTLLAFDMYPQHKLSASNSSSPSPNAMENTLPYGWHHTATNPQIVQSIRISPFPSPPVSEVHKPSSNKVRISEGSGAFTPYSMLKRHLKTSPVIVSVVVPADLYLVFVFLEYTHTLHEYKLVMHLF